MDAALTISSDIQWLVDYMPVDSAQLANAIPDDRSVAEVRRNVTLLAQFASNIDVSGIDDAILRQSAIEAIREVRRVVEQLTPMLTRLMMLPEACRLLPQPSLTTCADLYGALVRAATSLMDITHPRLTFILAPACSG